MAAQASKLLESVRSSLLKKNIPDFRPGDTVKVHARIVEGTKERVQIFQGVVIRRRQNKSARASFTVRKVSYNVGVERTFLLHSPRIEKIEVVNRGVVRRAKLFYLRDVRGKASRIKTKLLASVGADAIGVEEAAPAEQPATEAEA